MYEYTCTVVNPAIAKCYHVFSINTDFEPQEVTDV